MVLLGMCVMLGSGLICQFIHMRYNVTSPQLFWLIGSFCGALGMLIICNHGI